MAGYEPARRPERKLLGFFAVPSNVVVLIGIGGLLLLPTRFARADGGLHL
jgi:hypothetical protein